MNIATVTQGERGFKIMRDNQSPAEFPFVWLSDNDPSERHQINSSIQVLTWEETQCL